MLAKYSLIKQSSNNSVLHNSTSLQGYFIQQELASPDNEIQLDVWNYVKPGNSCYPKLEDSYLKIIRNNVQDIVTFSHANNRGHLGQYGELYAFSTTLRTDILLGYILVYIRLLQPDHLFFFIVKPNIQRVNTLSKDENWSTGYITVLPLAKATRAFFIL